MATSPITQTLVDRPLLSLMTRGNRYKKLKLYDGFGLLNNFTRDVTLQAVLNRLATLIGFRGRKMRAEDIIQVQAMNVVAFIKGRKKTYRPFISTY